MSKYEKIKGHVGIRKDVNNNRYLATKYINGKSFSRKFDNLRDAINWRANFHPSLPESAIENSIKVPEIQTLLKPSAKLNGEDLGYYFRDVWKLYCEIYIPSLELSTQWVRLAKEFFYIPLMDYKMVEITSGLLDRVIAFFKELPPYWRDFAETQFYMGARVSEVAGLQVDSVDLHELEICIKYVAVWSYQTKCFDHLKETPKNGEISYASMNQKLEEIMRRRIPLAQNGFVFHLKGKPLTYRQIQYQYNQALKRAGLADKYSSTHIMRHSMGTITRRVTGSVDMAQAVTRHKDIKVAQQYASLPTEANRKAVNDVNLYLDELEGKSDDNDKNRKPKLRLV